MDISVLAASNLLVRVHRPHQNTRSKAAQSFQKNRPLKAILTIQSPSNLLGQNRLYTHDHTPNLGRPERTVRSSSAVPGKSHKFKRLLFKSSHSGYSGCFRQCLFGPWMLELDGSKRVVEVLEVGCWSVVVAVLLV